jgi:uncharacterized protein YdhG (YjbR/CyaY superfamily)
MLDHLLRHVEFLDGTIAAYDRHIETLTAPHADHLARLDTIPDQAAHVLQENALDTVRLSREALRRQAARVVRSLARAARAVVPKRNFVHQFRSEDRRRP